jgi:hypothetical protein
MAKKLTFTPTGFDSLKAGKLADAENPGLFLEVLGSGKKQFKYSRRLNPTTIVRMTFGSYPAQKIANAREWAQGLSNYVEQGIDPRVVEREAKAAQEAQEAEDAAQAAALANVKVMTLNDAHALYMEAVERNEHKVTYSVNTHPLKPQTIADKLYSYTGYIQKPLGERPLASITDEDLEDIVLSITARGSKVQANRVACELKVFFNWVVSRRARPHKFGIKVNPAAQLHELWNGQSIRTRHFARDELVVFLKAITKEDLVHRRALLILLLTGCRKMNVLNAPMSEIKDGYWTIPEDRTKGRMEHQIKLGPWLTELMKSDSEWLIPSHIAEDRGMIHGWSRVTQRVTERMDEIEGKGRKRWVLHDLRRTFRNHIDTLVDDERTAELMMNHKVRGIVARYNSNRREDQTAAGFLAWENMVAQMAREAGVANRLGVPTVTTKVAPQSTPIPLAA